METRYAAGGDRLRPGIGSAPWSSLTEAAKSALTESAQPIRLARGESVEATVGIVTTGVLGLARTLSDGRRVYCALFHANDLVALCRTSRPVEGALTAITPAELLVFDAARLDRLTHDHPDLARLVIAQLCEHFARMRDHCTDLATKTPIERVACALLEFRRWPDAEGLAAGSGTIRLPLRQTDIADYIGVKPETVSRTLKKLADERVIALIERDVFALLDVPALRMIANGGRPRRSTS